MAGLLWLAAPAAAQPTEQVLFDGLLVLDPGDTPRRCFAVDRGVLTVIAASPPGRTGEDAWLGFAPNRETARPEVFLSAPLALDNLIASHLVDAGSYCYWVSVTNRLADTGDPNRPERPTKQVRIKITHESRP